MSIPISRSRQQGRGLIAVILTIALACVVINLIQPTIICDDGSPRSKHCWDGGLLSGYVCKHHTYSARKNPQASKWGPLGWARFSYSPRAQTAIGVSSRQAEKIWVVRDAFLVIMRDHYTLDCDNLDQWGQFQLKQRYTCKNSRMAPGHILVKYADNQLRKWALPERWWRAAGIDPQWQAVTGIDFEPPSSLPLRFMATGCRRRFVFLPSAQAIYEMVIKGLILLSP